MFVTQNSLFNLQELKRPSIKLKKKKWMKLEYFLNSMSKLINFCFLLGVTLLAYIFCVQTKTGWLSELQKNYIHDWMH